MFQKRLFTITAGFLLLSAALIRASVQPVEANSQYLLSPALGNIANQTSMIKSGLIYTDIFFEKSDFDRGVGCAVDAITITALPPQSSGTLMLGNSPVAVNQTVSAANLNYLRFVPSDKCLESTFRFKAEGEYSMECSIRFVTSVNYAPDANPAEAAASLWTQRDISIYGSLSGSDPEGDRITFEILQYPQSGLLTLTDAAVGNYKYTPYDGFTGDDTFCYAVYDEYGNYSEEQLMTVTVDKPVTELVFADMSEHWAHNAALVMVSENSMDVVSKGGQIYFNPDENMTRENFLVTVMKALGAEEIEPCDTVFADNKQISEENRGYIDRAYRLGIIKGVSENGKLYFNPADEITRAEAAVVINAILGLSSPDTVPVFADSASVPAWAKSSLYALHNAGILNGTGAGYLSSSAPMSRAQTAQVLLTIKKLYES